MLQLNIGYSLSNGYTGSVHHVCRADIDRDGVDGVLVAWMGVDPYDWKRTGFVVL
ncbi:hypothetical protein SCHPADRAFT_911170 [Schizopora paradoxa]|uniref:Uncharacterized protein n=1 Tax=Schizopora paradoxa TaxID=27342 RepID=A0A0H2R0A3_9AGAM|nr:hypothetical protein SCHPADRAFT_911170 [Schizopora paradoxa]